MRKSDLLILSRTDLVQISETARPRELRVPSRPPVAGEQFRFHFDMGKCIGCKCCVVACNEQNGNPADIQWRKVGEIEGGIFPDARRFHLSMACNHCLEPTCLSGCPVGAYTKDGATGIVDHSAEACIGCQYCVWNCSYGVPRFNSDRGVVGKCDMCHSRLDAGFAPACVDACPEGAIAIEIVDIVAWRADFALANAPGLPDAKDSISTTRVSVAPRAQSLDRVDAGRIAAQPIPFSLVGLLVLMQAAAGASWFDQPLWALALALVGLAFAPLHLGRPIRAYRAWIGWRTSWLSREVLAFGAYGGAAAMAAYDARFNPLAAVVGAIATYCSARIYMIPARPAWNRSYTIAEFALTALIIGALLDHKPLAATAAIVVAMALDWFKQTPETVSLARPIRLAAIALRGLAIVAIPFTPILALTAAGAAEVAARAAFFAAVVPKSVAGTFQESHQ